MKKLVSVLLSFVCAYSLKYVFYESVFKFLSNSILSIIMVIGFYLLINNVLEKDIRKGAWIFSGIMGFIYACFTVMGNIMYYEGNIYFFDPRLFIGILLVTVTFTFIVAWITYWIEHHEVKDVAWKFLESKYIFLVLGIVLVLVAMLAELGMYPGIVDPDNTFEFDQYMNHYYTGQHPIAHIFLMGSVFNLGNNLFGSYNSGIFMYVLLQMILFSASFMYVLYTMRKEGVAWKYVLITYALVAFNPVMHLFLISTTKDTIFTSFFIVSVTMIYGFIKYPEKIKDIKKVIVFIIVSVLACAFRNNAFYAYILFALLFPLLEKKYWVYRFVSVLLICVIFFGYQKGMTAALNIEPVPAQESLGIPLQQIARVYNQVEDSFTEEEKELLFEVLPEANVVNYNGYCVDYIKFGFNSYGYRENKAPYQALWVQKLKEYPTVYLNAFLENTLFIWYPDAPLNPYDPQHGIGKVLLPDTFVALTAIYPPEELNPKSTLLYTFYDKVAHQYYVQSVPGISMILCVGSYFWVSVYFFLFSIYKKKWNWLFLSLLPMSYLGTLFFGPVVLTRYFMFLMTLVPAGIGLLCNMATEYGKIND